ncbi:MAG: hypothetical protein ABIN36_03795 [Ferruginibacter sp.]
MSRKKILLATVIVLLLLASGTGYYFYNKGPVDVQESNSIKTNASDLYELYLKGLPAVQKNYTGKVLLVSGEVYTISLNQQKKQILLLKTNADGAYINCTMEENTGNLRAHHTIKVKGICSGIGEGDVDLGIKGDVYITRCYLVK